MTSGYKTAAACAALMALAVLSACTQEKGPGAATPKPETTQRTKEQMIDLGRQHKTAFELYQALREEAIAARIRDLGASPRITTPAETLSFIRAERADFGAIAKAGNIRVE